MTTPPPIGTVALAIVPGAFPLEQFLAHWWVFPASVLFSTIALSSGVSGALFFSPFFMLVVGLSPSQAIGAGLLTMVFGMGNGFRSYVKQRVVDLDAAKWLLVGAVPAVVLGATAAHYVRPSVLKALFGAGLVILGGFLAYHDPTGEGGPGGRGGVVPRETDGGRGETVIEAVDGETYRYGTCRRLPGVVLALVGAFATGLISAGLPEITTTQLIVRCRFPPRVAVATSVSVLAITAVVGAVVHALSATPVWYVVGWSVPGVLVGSTVGARVGKHLPGDLLKAGIGTVFVLVGGLVLALEFAV